MTTPRKDTDLAVRRRAAREIAEVDSQSHAVTKSFVQPALATVLSNAQRIIATELAFIADDQSKGERMDAGQSKALQSLLSGLATTVTLEAAAKELDLDKLSDDQLEAQLVAELEQLRANKRQK